MELTQLHYFYTVAQTQNITTAAEMLHIAQPTLSKVIKRLEEDLGVQLFDRKASKISLNPFGEAYLVYAEMALDALTRGRQHLENMRTSSGSGIRLASSFAGLPNLLVEQFALQHPDLSVTEVGVNPEEIASLLIHGHVDFALTLSPLEQMELEELAFIVEPMLLYLPASVDPVDSPTRLGDYQHLHYAIFEGGKDSYANFLRCCDLAGFVPIITYRCSQSTRVYDLVNHLNVCTMMPAHSALQNWHRLPEETRQHILLVDEPRCNRRVRLYRTRKEDHSKETEIFTQFAISFFHNMNAELSNELIRCFPEKLIPVRP